MFENFVLLIMMKLEEVSLVLTGTDLLSFGVAFRFLPAL
jgi:hypothetical protein